MLAQGSYVFDSQIIRKSTAMNKNRKTQFSNTNNFHVEVQNAEVLIIYWMFIFIRKIRVTPEVGTVKLCKNCQDRAVAGTQIGFWFCKVWACTLFSLL